MSKALTGKWQWNSVIEPMYDASYVHYVWFKSGFTSNGQRFEGIRFRFDDFWRLEYNTGSGYVEAGAGYYGDDYATPFEQYRVIDFGTGSEADDDSDGTFIKWFLSNVTRYGTVADKLVQIAENEKAVYQSGYDKALEKGGYDQGFEDGKDDEYKAFWNVFQNNGNRTDYQNAFSGVGWTEEIFKPKYPFGTVTNAYQMFRNSHIKADLTKFDIDISNVANADYMFYSSYFTKIGTFGVQANRGMNTTFGECIYLKTIEKLKVVEATVFNGTFVRCSALENITFEGVIGNDINFQWSTLLTKASITNIIKHLSLDASGKTLTLSQAAVDREFKGVSAADFTTIVEGSISAEWIGWIASRSNWNIKLV